MDIYFLLVIILLLLIALAAVLAIQKLARANRELKRLDDAKSEFLSLASHQLRTPLTITKGYISMLLEGNFGQMSETIKDTLDKLYLANERLIGLVENLLNISRIEAGRIEFKLRPVDLAVVAKSLVDDFQNKAKAKKIKLQFYADSNINKVVADEEKIKEVISNLLDNAVKYTAQGEIIVNLHQEGQSIVFACQDTGCGLEPADLPKLFNKFGRGQNAGQIEGSGLGLYYARAVIENMGGRVWAESPGKNQGSKFCFSLPLFDKNKTKKIKK